MVKRSPFGVWSSRRFGLEPKPIELWCDNKSNIKIAQNPMFHAATKHIEARHHFIREQIQLGNVDLVNIPFEDQVANIQGSWKGQIPRAER